MASCDINASDDVVKYFHHLNVLIDRLTIHQLIPTEEKKKLILVCLRNFSSFFKKLNASEWSAKIIEDFFHLFNNFVQRRDIDNEHLPSMVKIYYDLALIAVKAGLFELSLRMFSLALGIGEGLYSDSILKQFVVAKNKALSAQKLDAQILEKTIPEHLNDVSFKYHYDSYYLLCQEFYLYKQQNSLSWCLCVVMQIFKQEKDSLRRAHGFVMLAKLLYEDNSLHSESSYQCCCEAVRLLSSIKTASFLKWKFLCEAYIWKHLCFMQEKRNIYFDETASSVSSDKDLFDGKQSKSFELATSKILCSMSDFEQTIVWLDEAFNIWDSYLAPQFDSCENLKERNDCLELYSTMARIALLIPKPKLALKALLWLITKRTSFVDWYSLLTLIYDNNDYCRFFFTEQNFNSLGEFDSFVLSIIRVGFYCSINEIDLAVNEYNECENVLSRMDKTQSFFRLFSMFKYFSTCFLRLPIDKIPDRFKTATASTVCLLSDCYSKAFGLLKGELGLNMDVSKIFCRRTDIIAFDTVWCLRRIFDLATSFDHCSLPDKAAKYFSEGFEVARRLGYPYWTLLFLNAYLRIVFLSNDKTNIFEYLEAAQNLFATESLSPNSSVYCKKASKTSKKVVKSESNCIEMVKKPNVGSIVESARRDAHNAKIDATLIPNTSNVSEENFDHIRHKSRCHCAVCDDYLLSSSKAYFLYLLERYHYSSGQQRSCCFEIETETLGQFTNSLQQIIDEEASSSSSSCSSSSSSNSSRTDKLLAPNFVWTYLCFLADFWFDEIRLLFSAKKYSQAGELLEKISPHLFSSETFRLTNSFRLWLNFWQTKLSIASVCVDDVSNQMAALSITNSKKAKKDSTKRATIVKQQLSTTNTIANKLSSIENDLKNFGHLLYYPWYREANEFVLSQRFPVDLPTVAAVHFVELFAISVRHSAALIERTKTIAGKLLSNRLKRIENTEQLRDTIKLFPKELTLVFLYLTNEGELILARLSPRCDPLIVNLGRAIEKFDAFSIINDIRISIKSSVDSLEKREFWTKRNDINSRLEKFAETLERSWFDTCKALLLGYRNDENSINDNSSIPSSVFEVVSSAAEILKENEFDELTSRLCISLAKSAQKRLLTKLKFGSMFSSDDSRGPVILILDKNLHSLPFESMPIFKHQPVSRSVSLHALVDSIDNWRLHNSVEKSNVYYILNPSQDLVTTQNFFETSFINSGWKGCIGKQPSMDEIEDVLTNKSLVVYCGHGSGSSIVSGSLKQITCQSSVVLMGCSSGKYITNGSFYEASGNISLYQLAMCPSVVGCLWEVTDRDIDTFLEYFLCSWLRYKNGEPSETYPKNKNCSVPDVLSLAEAVAKSRQFCKLNYLTGAAPVVYGLPVDALR